jgi:hypothetical protein
VINGTVGTISDIVAEVDGHALIAASVDGRELLFSSREVVDDTGRVRLVTDYASTVWSSQGLTCHTRDHRHRCVLGPQGYLCGRQPSETPIGLCVHGARLDGVRKTRRDDRCLVVAVMAFQKKIKSADT